ncbi:MAG: hypothetical protein CL710_02245 [Chloroflexi bacterium]|nr:hypothetical protein [Chloroflexota bacterium]|tara:strand:+ start:8012 stop:8449 length:438 start_codon:yes stop_codon:yes gene_type:complete
MDENELNDDKEKLKKEIEDLLNEINDFPKNKKNFFIVLLNKIKTLFTKILFACIAVPKNIINRISLNQLFLFSVVLIIFSLFFRRINPLLMQWLFILASILFVVSFAGLALFKRENKKEKYWRGRIIKYENDSIFKKFLKLFKKD